MLKVFGLVQLPLAALLPVAYTLHKDEFLLTLCLAHQLQPTRFFSLFLYFHASKYHHSLVNIVGNSSIIKVGSHLNKYVNSNI